MDFRVLKRTGPERQNAGTHGPIHHVPYLSSFFLSTAPSEGWRLFSKKARFSTVLFSVLLLGLVLFKRFPHSY